jgi:hypothetical protein
MRGLNWFVKATIEKVVATWVVVHRLFCMRLKPGLAKPLWPLYNILTRPDLH